MALGLLWAVLAAVATNMAVGMLWYGWIFKDPWMRAMGVEGLTERETEQMQQQATPGYIVSMVSAGIATILLWFLYGWADAMPVDGWVKGLELGFMAWLGFYVGPSLTTEFFEDRRWTAWVIGAGYWGVLAMLYGVYVGLLH